jgi:tetratricopeptide (TPR) repeat protein
LLIKAVNLQDESKKKDEERYQQHGGISVGIGSSVGDSMLINDLADCLDLEGKPKEAQLYWIKALQQNPTMPFSLEMKAGDPRLRWHEPAKSIEIYKKAVAVRQAADGKDSSHDTQLARDYTGMAVLYVTVKDNESAEEYFKKAAEICNAYPNAPAFADFKIYNLENYIKMLKDTGRASETEDMEKTLASLQH